MKYFNMGESSFIIKKKQAMTLFFWVIIKFLPLFKNMYATLQIICEQLSTPRIYGLCLLWEAMREKCNGVMLDAFAL